MRIIARLDIKNENVIKGIHLEGLRVIGNPIDLALKYYHQKADEIIFMDAVASLYRRNSLFNIIETACNDIFIPVTIGGGIKSIDDVHKALNSGADKVAINTACLEDPNLIDQVSKRYGSQCLTVSIEAKTMQADTWSAYTANGKENSNRDVIEWIKEVQDRGAGEILITSIDKEGTKKGFDLNLLSEISKISSIPVIASGGAGDIAHIQKVKDLNISAVALASILHYDKESVTSIKSQIK